MVQDGNPSGGQTALPWSVTVGASAMGAVATFVLASFFLPGAGAAGLLALSSFVAALSLFALNAGDRSLGMTMAAGSGLASALFGAFIALDVGVGYAFAVAVGGTFLSVVRRSLRGQDLRK